MQPTNVLALSCATLNPSQIDTVSGIGELNHVFFFFIQDKFDHALTIHENTFNHVKKKFINIHFNNFLVRAWALNLGVMIFWKISCVHVKTLLKSPFSLIIFSKL